MPDHAPTLEDHAQVWVIDLTYRRPLEDVDRHRAEHLEVLDRFADAGIIVASGPKSPRTGGVIVTSPVSRHEVDEMIAADPFHHHRIADYTVTGLTPRGVLRAVES